MGDLLIEQASTKGSELLKEGSLIKIGYVVEEAVIQGKPVKMRLATQKALAMETLIKEKNQGCA